MRVARCMRVPIGQLVSVLYNPEHEAASFGGLATCGSVWTCPVCSARIGARRTEEINQAAAIWKERGGFLCMVTLTLRHHKARRLAELYKNARDAYRAMMQGSRWVNFRKRYKIAGYITSREITDGINGWHPHFHVLVFCREPLDSDMRQTMTDWYSQRWRSCLADVGENADQAHGAVMSDADDVAGDYMAKLSASWSSGSEIAGVNSKSGKKGGQVPAQLLAKYAAGDVRAGLRYKEFASATFNTSWLEWSRGLRAEIFGDETEETDEEIAAKAETGAVTLIELTQFQWFSILRRGLRGELIELACNNDRGELLIFLAENGLQLESWQLPNTLAATETAPA